MSIPRAEGFLDMGDGGRIWFETAGVGADIVLCHGLGGNAAVWYQQVAYFARSYRVTTWDQRGFGRSSGITRQYEPLTAVSDLVALLKHLDVSRACLVGQSLGGWTAMGAALSEPQRIRSLVLACTTGGIPVNRERAAAKQVGAGGTSGDSALPLGEHPAIDRALVDRDPARAYLYQALGSFGDRPPDGEMMNALAGTSFDADEIGGLKTPVLLIAGERDALMTPALLRRAATYLSHPTVVELHEVGHSPYFEDPEAWNATVKTFLAKSA